MILLNPVLIMEGSPVEIVVGFVSSIAAAYFLAAGLQGYLLRAASWWQRLFLIAGGLVLLIPGWGTDLVGLALVLIPTLAQFVISRRSRRSLMVQGVRDDKWQ